MRVLRAERPGNPHRAYNEHSVEDDEGGGRDGVDVVDGGFNIHGGVVGACPCRCARGERSKVTVAAHRAPAWTVDFAKSARIRVSGAQRPPPGATAARGMRAEGAAGTALALALAALQLAGINDAARGSAPPAVWCLRAGQATGDLMVSSRIPRRGWGLSPAASRSLPLRGGSDWDLGDSEADDRYGEGPALQGIEELPPADASTPGKRVNMTALDMLVTTRGAGGGDDAARVELAATLAASGINAQEIEREFSETVQRLADMGVTDVRNERVDETLPVQQPFEAVVEEQDIMRRWVADEIPSDEEEELRAQGKGALLPDLEDVACPPREALVSYILDFIEHHQRTCSSGAECDGFLHTPEEEWEAGLMGAEYADLLRLYRQISIHEIEPTPQDHDDKYWSVDGEYIPEANILDVYDRHNVPTMRCKVDPSIPHCNLCWDHASAAKQIAEGERNRDFSRRRLPVTVPDHYATVREALAKSFWFTFFDDEADRGWMRRCRFWPGEAQAPLAADFIENHWWCVLELSPRAHSRAHSRAHAR